MKMTHTRVTARILNEPDNLLCQARLVERADLESIERVFKTFGIDYDVDELPSNTRLYSLSISLQSRFICNELLTSRELSAYLSPFVGRGGAIQSREMKELLNGTTSEIYKSLPDGEIMIGYELTLKGGEAPFTFRLPHLSFRRAKPVKTA
jgi:hypothetical protein